ncbi:MAG: alpha/beta fold hydrolase [Deltaproteobacteria bacterium]|nr:alpha/beta fold hydrolase [Deltaproteobacteria bacterium]
MVPSIQFCETAHGRRLAYSRLGEGPLLVLPPAWISHLGVLWENLGFQRFVGALAQHNTVVWFDRQGCGFSARGRVDFSVDEDVLDLETVIAQFPEQPLSLFAVSCAGPVAVTYAVRHPERVKHLVLYGTFARGERLGPELVRQSVLGMVHASWGLGAKLLTEMFIPADSGAAQSAAEWFTRFQRESATSQMAGRLLEAMYATDVLALLSQVRCPTLVLHRREDRAIPERAGRELAAGIAGARFVELAGKIHLAWFGDTDQLLHQLADFLGEPAPSLSTEPGPVRYEVVHRDVLGAAEAQPRFRVGLAQLDVPFESFTLAGDGLVSLRSDAIPDIARKLAEALERAAARHVELLLLPELSVDSGLPALYELLAAFARATGAVVVPGAFHVPARHANLCRVIGPAGVLWEQEKHIAASFTLDGRRVTEGIQPQAQRRVVIADTRFGRVAIAICRDFLDLDLRVELKNAEPPVDIVLNPAFTPVTADFEAAHFEARRSLYAYSLFCNAARFGNSVISSPERGHRRLRAAPGREALLFKDVDLLALRAARRHWEAVRGAVPQFIQSTRG